MPTASTTARSGRDYAGLTKGLPLSADREARMQHAVDALWAALAPTGVSWVGFYLKAAGRDELVLGPRRDKPACSPIGMHGACGRCFLSGRALVVTDVAKLGAGYIACDPRDRSEVVAPLFEDEHAGGACWGVLDLDSHDAGAFGEEDARGLMRAMERAGLSAYPSAWAVETI